MSRFMRAATTWTALFVGLALLADRTPAVPRLTRGDPVAMVGEHLAIAHFGTGQEALSHSQYRAAIEAFRKAHEESPDPAFRAEALYWLAFSLFRGGGTTDLEQAEEALELLLTNSADSAKLDDAAELVTRIRGELARRGDAEAAAHIAAKAEELARETARLALATRDDIDNRTTALLAAKALRLKREAEAFGSSGDSSTAALLSKEAQCLHQEALIARELMPYELGRLPISLEPSVTLSLLTSDPKQEDDVRLTALQALAETDEKRALPILRRVLARRDEGSARLREKAIMILALHRSRESEKLLLDAARDDPDRKVRGVALYHLGEVSNDEALLILEDALFQTEDRMLQEQAIKGLSMQDAEDITQIFRDVASREDMPVDFRERAIHLLNWKGSDKDFLFLRQLYDRVDEPSLKETIVMAVGNQKGRETREWLLRLIKDESNPPEAREKAFFWAGEDKQVSTDELVELYEGLEGGESRKQAVHVIGQRKDAAALNFLLRTALEEPHSEARSAAIFWLGQSNDPRAVDCLEEIIGK